MFFFVGLLFLLDTRFFWHPPFLTTNIYKYKTSIYGRSLLVLSSLLNGVGVDDEVNHTEEEIHQRVDVVSHTLDYVEWPAVLRNLSRLLVVRQKKFASYFAAAIWAFVLSHHFLIKIINDQTLPACRRVLCETMGGPCIGIMRLLWNIATLHKHLVIMLRPPLETENEYTQQQENNI